ncbi:MerR-like DNA binding protein [Motilibacter rhizosphaerae]|uniref:MerR-like DNA binding protein n=1 Tax=Motilibacter rhizosphaerae TaxID=598652 RepID=A0A4Q7NC71_9ACTN|nr:MerR family transcriptional regulator [Motilibacter rhizosphaerae]RZS80207.1 MerR-like DNA binding protein [Motilibacter rhizosphaerae]
MSALPAPASRSIGEVLAELRQEFSDVTISKIRFLEAEGLVEPQRTPSGYRKFSTADVERLRYVLRAQRDHYLPLRVIKDHLDALDRGLEPPQTALTAPRVPRVVPEPGTPLPADAGGPPLRLSRRELCEAAGLEERQLAEVEGHGLLRAPEGGWYDRDDLRVAQTVAELARFGVEARHLRPFRTAAQREADLVLQVTDPLQRQRQADSQARREEAVRELCALTLRLHALLVKAAVDGEDR